MTSRRDLDKAFARSPVIGSEPRTDIFGRIGIHPDRLSLHSLPMEAKFWAQSLRSAGTAKPFVIYGRPRSGTTLLVRLLDQVPAVHCHGELLHFFLVNPVGFLRSLPRRAKPGMRACGVKLISYHLMEVQRIRRPLAFFDKISEFDYSVIHLTRNTWDQTLSLAKAQVSGLYFPKGKTGAQSLRLDPERFLALLKWNADMLAYETEVMSHVPHHLVCYETGLRDAHCHQSTIDDICRHLGVTSASVTATMKRTGGEGGLQKVENLDEVAAHVRRSALAHLVPEGV
jgi:hypothetical protein